MTSRWRKGQSGNPKGKPPGCGHVQKLREAIGKDMEEIIQIQVEKAKQGDSQAARLLLERTIPPSKPTEQPTPMELPADCSMSDQARAILAAVASGEIAAGQASQMLQGLASAAKIIETEELAARIAALEQANEHKS